MAKIGDYDVSIITEKSGLTGDWRYVARVHSLERMITSYRGIGVIHDFGETWGDTKEEAERKMRDRVREWLEQNPDSSQW